ncbi:MAG: hypothetical protein RIC19_20930 [Phaeodactylibacter sp.]|uniref:hypothetical protein n=1 Tax=Phaeodactylibacter sp. TaxID=1940289 RepID=UPI0032EAADDF
MTKSILLSLCLLIAVGSLLPAQSALWSVDSYPDETGLQMRMAPMLPRIAAEGFAQRSLANSKCPDTGLPVKTWAVKGETIYSPYTGRAYQQGDTGYFGPKARNEDGEISAFGGDPLKYELQSATAQLLLHPGDVLARGFLSIPGNLRQQYHFACTNWARFYPYLADEMGEDWKARFHQAVATYEETRRPSDGYREYAPMSHPHDLVGEEGTLLGGNTIDGGTENHKTMWRTSCLVYSQWMPEGAKISGYELPEAETRVRGFLTGYAERMLQTGNGEYDSQIYYPYSIEGYMNLYDFAQKPEDRALAKFTLDYYFATTALKLVDGHIAGGMKRGYLPKGEPDKMEKLFWGYFDDVSRDMSEAVTTVHQATTGYRPNAIISRIARGEVALPYEARMTRPFYHMDRKNGFQESFYRSHTFGLGNVYMSIVDNPNQQMVWSLMVQGEDGPLGFTGGQPLRLTTSGHSPYTQTLHSKNTLLLLSAPSELDEKQHPDFQIFDQRINPWHLPDSAQAREFELANRWKYATEPLQPVSPPAEDELEAFWEQKKYSAASWLLIPKQVELAKETDRQLIWKAPNTWVAVWPVGTDYFMIDASAEAVAQVKDKTWRTVLEQYIVLVVTGQQSGYAIEVLEGADHPDLNAVLASLKEADLETERLKKNNTITYESTLGEKLEMTYRPDRLKAYGRINGTPLDFENWAGGAVYDSPYVRIKDGVMEMEDGTAGYRVFFRDGQPVYELLNEKND